ncbi:MAG: PQQ-binding-like beta-propeller repeat protein [Candidatus Marinimicrobia bacterium]|nr:PQQ-binding-like beta-propeller repeat protein [Candidatus Neomarinimicrobiota bacterium]
MSAITTILIGFFVFNWWINASPPISITISLPGQDDAPDHAAAAYMLKEVDFGSVKVNFNQVINEIPGEWPRFRGTDYSNISEVSGLIDKPEDLESRILWSVDLGEGHAGAAVKYGRVYVLDYDEIGKADILRCFSLSEGHELWHTGYNVSIKRNHGITRTIPAVSDSFVVTIGPRCHVMCIDAFSGDLLWGLDLERDFGVKVPLWYTGQCPLIDGSTAVIAVGGDDLLMMGVDCQTGNILWQIPNTMGWKMSHSSIIPMNFFGVRQYVYSAIGGIMGVSAEEHDKGQLLWSSNIWSQSVIAPTPVQLENNRIFVTAGYSAGSMLLQVIRTDDNFFIESIQTVTPAEGIASEQQTPIYNDGLLCGVLPKDAGVHKEQFACFDETDITSLVWTSGKTRRFGLGPYLRADDKYFILDDEGVLTVINAGIDHYEEIFQFDLLQGHDAWAPMALVDGKLILRDSKTMICLDISKTFRTATAL